MKKSWEQEAECRTSPTWARGLLTGLQSHTPLVPSPSGREECISPKLAYSLVVRAVPWKVASLDLNILKLRGSLILGVPFP